MMTHGETKTARATTWARTFLQCESGATTMDLMMIASVVVSLGIGTIFITRDSATVTLNNTAAVMEDGSFDPSGLATRPAPGSYVVDTYDPTASDGFVKESNRDTDAPYNEDDNGDEIGGFTSVGGSTPSGGGDDADAQTGGDTTGGDTTADAGGETGGDAGGEAGGDPSGDADAHTGGETAGDTSGETAGDTSGEVAGDSDAGADGDSGGPDFRDTDVVEEPDPYQEYLNLYNELYATLDTPELNCFRNNGEIRINQSGNLPKRCRGQGLEELIELQNQVYG